MDEPRLIKKYPNRRLYDTVSSRYITLDEIKTLVLKHVVFNVIDGQHQDVTDHVLLQILAQEESTPTPIFTRQTLQNIIRFYGHPLQTTLCEFLEKGIAMFSERESSMHAYLQTKITEDESFNKIAAATKHNLEIWQSVLTQFIDNDKNNSNPEG
jgi:polyhydroxyalkanoate synthesis repressor PhaR